MRYILFIGYKIGYIALTLLLEKQSKIEMIVIDREHPHEHEKYDTKITNIAINNNIPFIYSNNKSLDTKLKKINCNYMLIFGYRKLISDHIYQQPKNACIACHFSLLPKYRGFSPINWAIINGESQSGLTFFHLSDDIDNGDIVTQKKFEILLEDDVAKVYEKAYAIFLKTLDSEIDNLNNNWIKRVKQNNKNASYCCSRAPEDGLINWKYPALDIYNLIRGISYPWPGAFTFYKGEKLTIWESKIYKIPHYVGIIPGRVIKIVPGTGVVVLLSKNALLITKIQLEGQAPCTADKVIKSVRSKLG
jgi:methionyl-tRNA formyltransferase